MAVRNDWGQLEHESFTVLVTQPGGLAPQTEKLGRRVRMSIILIDVVRRQPENGSRA